MIHFPRLKKGKKKTGLNGPLYTTSVYPKYTQSLVLTQIYSKPSFDTLNEFWVIFP